MEQQQKIFTGFLVITLVLLIFNSYQINGFTEERVSPSKNADGVIPTGVPKIYGNELSISYDDVSPSDPYKADQTIKVLADIDRSTELTGADLERYITILYKKEQGISCEYCCGARSIIFENGKQACGCAHSYAMRGLTKYLITKHGQEYTDDEIAEEVGKWKVLFFPTQMQNKAMILEQQNIKPNYINLATNKHRGIEKGTGSGGGMVGGC